MSSLLANGSGGDIGWSNAWKINFHARLLDGEEAHAYLCRLIGRNAFPNLMDACWPGRLFQIDGNLGGAAGIAEMLLRSDGPEHVVRFLPALPEAWKTGTFRGLRARGAFEINLEWDDGKPVKAEVLSLAGNKFHIKKYKRVKVRQNGTDVPTDDLGSEELAEWPFWKRGEAYFLRGRAFAETGASSEGEADLARALEFTTDSRIRLDVWLALATNRENNLDNGLTALEAYQHITNASKNNGSATYYRGVQGAARILRKLGRYDDALATLRKVDIAALRGYWHGSMLVALGDTLAAAGRKDDAFAAYREVLTDEGVRSSDRKNARKAIKALTES